MIRTIGLLCAGSICCGSVVLAGGRTAPNDASQDIATVLQRELEAPRQVEDRRELLTAAREAHADPAAWWQSGFVKEGQGWASWEAALSPKTDLLQQYRSRRADATPDAASQLKLADWCRDSGLFDQERVHLIQSLQTGAVPDPVAVLKRLGYRRIGTGWYTDEEIALIKAESLRRGRTWSRLQPRLERLVARLGGGRGARQNAIQDLRRLANASTIPVLEMTLGAHNPSTAEALVEALSEVDSYHASQSLARLAVGSPWIPIRDAATEQLKGRRWEDFVPLTMSMMSMPTQLTFQRIEVPFAATMGLIQNRMEWRFVWSREGRTAVQVAGLRIIDDRDARAPLAQPLRISALDRELIARANRNSYRTSCTRPCRTPRNSTNDPFKPRLRPPRSSPK